MALTPSTMLELGTRAPDFVLTNAVDGRSVSLLDFESSKALLVMFICNHCPYVQHIRPELGRLAEDYRSKGLGITAINANSLVTHPQDGPDAMRELAVVEGQPIYQAEVQAASTRVIIIHRGRIVTDAPTDQIQKKMSRNRYEVVLEASDSGREDVRKALRAIEKVDRVDVLETEEPDVWAFEVRGEGNEDLRRAIFKFVVDGGHTLLELKPEKANLESVFMELTQE